jgi:ADP-heptose:LPS heptosyltransferase
MSARGDHVLVARLDNDGDVLLAGPALRAVAAGAGRVTLLCGPRGRAAAELLPGVDEIVVHRAPWIDPEPGPMDAAAQLALVDDLAERALDRALVLTSHHQSALPLALLLRLAGVPFVAATSPEYPGSLLDVRHAVGDSVHEVERSLSLAGACGYELPPGDDGRLRLRAGLEAAPRPFRGPYVVVHPGASVPARAWSPERAAELVDALVACGRRVAVTGSPAEAELTERVAGSPRPEVADLGGATSLAGLASVLGGAEAVVVGNTGPAHLAAAVGTPVVSLFAPTVPSVRWRPWKVPHDLLGVDVACAGCRARECPVPGHPCLEGVAVAEAAGAVERLARAALPTAGDRPTEGAPRAPREQFAGCVAGPYPPEERGLERGSERPSAAPPAAIGAPS